MIKMYVMKTCPFCDYVEKQVTGNNRFKIIDIGTNVLRLKDFLTLRDNNPAFNEAKKNGDVGIPCYVLEDGTVTLFSKDVGLEPMPEEQINGGSCEIHSDGTGC
ncbi:MAG TPA: glutaredoxin [Prevotella sp.]|nr:glutaredoxin [Prevotella sp.]